MKMNYFSHCHNLVMVILNIFFMIGISAATQDGSLEILGQDGMIEMAGYGHEKLSSVLFTGTVVCEACLQHHSQLRTQPVSDALVAVSCNDSGRKRGSSWVRSVTNEYGEFTIDLPSHLHAAHNLHKICSLRVLKIPKTSLCRVGHVRKHRGLKLSSSRNGIRTYTFGEIKFLQLKRKLTRACFKNGSSGRTTW